MRHADEVAGRWGHTDIVLVTVWGRPEFLLATLRLLALAVRDPSLGRY